MQTKTNGQENEIEILPDDHFALTKEEIDRMIAAGKFLRDKINFGENEDQQVEYHAAEA